MRSECGVMEIQRTVMKSACMVMLAACNPIKVPAPDAVGGDPDRSRDLMRQCKADWVKLGDASCRAGYDGWRRRQIGANRGAGATQSAASSVPPGGLLQ
jgi:hypothetical protein